MILKGEKDASAPALESGLYIIERLAVRREAGFNELCRDLPMSKASVSRILKVLAARGYVARDQRTERWVPGPRMNLLGGPVYAAEALRAESVPFLESFAAEAGNTVLCVYWNGFEFQVVSKVQPEGMASMLDIGAVFSDLSRFPWGWLFFLSLDARGRKAALRNMSLKELFERRLPDWEAHVLERGFAYDDHEIFPHVRRIGAPVRDPSGKIVGALGSAGSRATMPDKKVKSIGAMLAARAGALSEAISRRTLKP